MFARLIVPLIGELFTREKGTFNITQIMDDNTNVCIISRGIHGLSSDNQFESK